MAKRPRIQVLLDNRKLSALARQALAHVRAETAVHDFGRGGAAGEAEPCDARLVITADACTLANGKLARLHEWFDRAPCPTLVLSEIPMPVGQGPHARTTNGRAVEFTGPLSQDELAGRLAAMCGLHGSIEALRCELEEVRQLDRLLRADLRRLHDELRLAGVLQRDLLPSSLPAVAGAELDVTYRPAEMLSGDVYDVARLDESHIAIWLADATGHGVSAALLAAFVSRWLGQRGEPKGTGRPCAPEEVLAGLSRDLLDAQMEDCHFVASLFALYNEQTRTIRWARGGAPYPILVRQGEAPLQIESDGPLLGICSDAQFEVVELQLGPGDTVIFHTDGLEALLAKESGDLTCCGLDRTNWFRTLGSGPIKKRLEEVDAWLASTSPTDPRADDTTIVVLHLQRPITASQNKQRHKTRTHTAPVAAAV